MGEDRITAAGSSQTCLSPVPIKEAGRRKAGGTHATGIGLGLEQARPDPCKPHCFDLRDLKLDTWPL